MFGVTVVTPPAVEPLSLPEARRQVRVGESNDTHDKDLTALIVAARIYCERATGKAFITQTLKLTLDRFPGWREGHVIRLPRPPLASVSATGIKYDDTNGTEQTLAASAYVVDTACEPGRIGLAYGEVWPVTMSELGAVRITYVAGYGAAAAVPDSIKEAMKLLIGHWFSNREAVNVGNITSALDFSVSALLGCESAGVLVGTYG